MISASTNFETAIRQKIRRTGAKVQLDVITPSAIPNDWNTANQAPYSEPTQTTNNVLDCQRRVATCEPNKLKLDGLTTVETADEVGFVSSSLTDANGDLLIGFDVGLSSVVNCKGLTIFFDRLDGEYPVDFDVNFYNLGSQQGMFEYRDNTEPYITIYDETLNIDRVQIVIYTWSEPFHRVKISEIAFGVIEEWGTGTRSGLIELINTSEIDIKGESLPYGDAVAKIDNRGQEFNVINPSGVAKYLREGAKMQTFHGVKVNGDYEFIKTGTYFFKKWEDSGNNAVNLTAVDRLGFFFDKAVRLMYVGGNTNIGNYTMQLFLEAGAYAYFDENTMSETTSLVPRKEYEPTFGDELQKIAQYLMQVVVCDTDGTIKFATIDDVLESDIPRALSKKDPEIKQGEQISSVDISYYTRSQSTAREEFFSATYTVSGTLYVEIDVGYEYDGFNISVSAGTYSTLSPLYGKLSVNLYHTGDVTLSVAGYKINYQKTVLSIDNTENTDPNAKRITVDNKLVMSEAKAIEIANWTIDAYNKWYKYSCNWIGDPRIEVGDNVNIGNRYGADQQAIVTKKELRFTGGLSSNIEGVGS
jgi:hypothetical protein